MKTINYQLSNLRCLEEGWTLRAPSPMMEDEAEVQMFEVDLDRVTNLADTLSARVSSGFNLCKYCIVHVCYRVHWWTVMWSVFI